MAIGTPASLGSTAATVASTTIALTASTNVLAGDLVVVVVSNRAGQIVSGVSDGTNTYAKATSVTGGGLSIDCEIWYCEGATALSVPTITVTFAASSSNRAICAFRVDGVASTSSLDKVNSNSGTSGTGTVATATLAQADEIVVGVWNANTNSGVTTEGTGFTQIFDFVQDSVTVKIHVAYNIVSATTAVTYNPAWTAAGGWTMAIASFEQGANSNFGSNMPMMGL